MVVRGSGVQERGRHWSSGQTSSEKMNMFWGSSVQHGISHGQYCITSLKVAERVNLKHSHYTHKMIIMGGDECVN